MAGLSLLNVVEGINSHVRIENIAGLLLTASLCNYDSSKLAHNMGYKMLKQNRKRVPTKYSLYIQSLMLSQHSNWYIMADISKIRLNNSMVPNFVMKVDYNL